MNIEKYENIKKQIKTISELEEILVESWSSIIHGLHNHEKLKLSILERLDFLLFYSPYNYTKKIEQEIERLQKALQGLEQNTISYERMIEEKRNAMKVIAELKKANGISQNNTVQPLLVDWSV
jgi:hypothetical protein